MTSFHQPEQGAASLRRPISPAPNNQNLPVLEVRSDMSSLQHPKLSEQCYSEEMDIDPQGRPTPGQRPVVQHQGLSPGQESGARTDTGTAEVLDYFRRIESRMEEGFAGVGESVRELSTKINKNELERQRDRKQDLRRRKRDREEDEKQRKEEQKQRKKEIRQFRQADTRRHTEDLRQRQQAEENNQRRHHELIGCIGQSFFMLSQVMGAQAWQSPNFQAMPAQTSGKSGRRRRRKNTTHVWGAATFTEPPRHPPDGGLGPVRAITVYSTPEAQAQHVPSAGASSSASGSGADRTSPIEIL